MPHASLPPHIRFLMRHALVGFIMAGVIVSGVAVLDLGGFQTLAAQSGSAFVAFPALAFALGLTLASVQMGAAIMLLPRDEGRSGGPGLRSSLAALLVPPTPQPVPVRVRARR